MDSKRVDNKVCLIFGRSWIPSRKSHDVKRRRQRSSTPSSSKVLGRVRTCPHNVARKPLWSNIAAFVGQGRAHRCDISRRSPRAVRTSLRHFSPKSAHRCGISRPCTHQVRTSLRHFSAMFAPSPHLVAACIGQVRTTLRHFSPKSAHRCGISRPCSHQVRT